MRILSFIFTLSLLPLTAPAQTELVREGGAWKLWRDGKPYFIKGGGGDTQLDVLAAAGGNSIRLWGDDNLGEKLDAAQKAGLTVTAGIWLGQVRQGFNWSDAAGLVKQREHIAATVSKYKDHPALLMWALGNEMEDPEGTNGAVWTAINSLAVMVRQLDPAHPTMTVIAEIGGDKVRNLHALCPEIDIIGINSYAGGPSLGERYRKAGGTKPYVVTEFGPAGIWETGKDALGAYPEPTSTAKAAAYRATYEAAILGEPALCLGSYAFVWGHKQEVTATWFSMFLPDGARLAPVDTMTELWSGKAPANRCPEIGALALVGAAEGKPGATVKATLSASDPEKDALVVAWSLMRDAEEYGTGGDTEDAHTHYPDAIVKADATGAEVVLPKDGGLYRLFATVRDEHGGAAVANVLLRVDAPVTIALGADAELPLTVYAEATDALTYTAAGWMGDATAIKVDPEWTENPQAGATCMKCEFKAGEGWGGVVWQNPEGDWGDRAGGYNLTGAKTLAFWARGEKGGEVVSFSFGLIAAPKRFFDTGKGALEGVTLTKEWKRYEIPVEGQDLTRIKTGFVWTLASQGEPAAFYLDNVRWE